MIAATVIQKAYQNAGKIQRGGFPSTGQLADGLSTLQDIVAYEGTRGLKLWLETEVPITLMAGKQSYSFMPGGDISQIKPYRVKEASYVDSGGAVRPLTPVSREEWTMLTNRQSQGAINQYFVEKLFDRMNVYFWYIPDAPTAQGKVLIVLANQAQSPVLFASDTRFPPEWALFLQWRLAQELATGMSQETVTRCDQMTGMYREQLEGFDVEEAPTYFTVDTQGRMGSSFS